jgi:plastocyanin
MTMRAAPMAYSPDTGLLYAAGADDWPSWIIRGEDPKFFLALPTLPGMKYSGVLAGVDARTSKINWQKKVPYTTQHNMSGFTATKGGVVFHGEGDGNVQALDAKSGELLWQFQAGAPANGAVSSYDVGGTQYVAIAVSDGVWAFKLAGTVAPRPAPPAPKSEADFSGRIVPTDQIAMAGQMEDTGLNGDVRRMFNEFAFMPMRARISVGEKVTWTNAGKEIHAATAQDGSWTTGPVAPGKSVALTFSKPGTYTYTCNGHPWSLAQLIVEE